jgi:hypothetical protein
LPVRGEASLVGLFSRRALQKTPERFFDHRVEKFGFEGLKQFRMFSRTTNSYAGTRSQRAGLNNGKHHSFPFSTTGRAQIVS